MSRWDKLLAAFVAVAAVGVTVAISQRSVNDTRHQIETASYRQSVTLWHLLRSGCNRSVSERTNSMRLLALSAVANQAVADDNVNTTAVRHARGREAAAQRHAVTGLRLLVPPRFSCARAFPKPVAPAGVKPLP